MDCKYMTLSEAAQQSPGRVHSTAVWRWCRRGLRARNGQKIRLSHVRVGGRIFVKPDDLEAFFQAVAEADAEHFDNAQAVAAAPSPQNDPRSQHSDMLDRIDRELDEAGL